MIKSQKWRKLLVGVFVPALVLAMLLGSAGDVWADSAEINSITGNNLPNDLVLTIDSVSAGDAQPCPGTPTVTDIDGNIYNTVNAYSTIELKR